MSAFAFFSKRPEIGQMFPSLLFGRWKFLCKPSMFSVRTSVRLVNSRNNIKACSCLLPAQSSSFQNTTRSSHDLLSSSLPKMRWARPMLLPDLFLAFHSIERTQRHSHIVFFLLASLLLNEDSRKSMFSAAKFFGDWERNLPAETCTCALDVPCRTVRTELE
jgi:hypothetical protein